MADLRPAVIDALARVHEQSHEGYSGSCTVCAAVLKGWDAAQRGRAPAATVAAPVAPAPAKPVPVRSAAPTASTTPEQLLAALDAVPDDASRARLLAAASRDLRAQLNALLAYRELSAPSAQEAAFAEFSRRLDAAVDDAERAAIIAGTDKTFRSEWAWRQDATEDDWRRRYLASSGAVRENEAD